MKPLSLLCLLLVLLYASSSAAQSAAWEKIGLTGGNIVDMESFPADPDVMLACIADHGIYRSNNRGDYWSQIIADPCSDIAISEDDVAFIVGPSGVLVSHDFGETWEAVSDEPAYQVVAYRDGIVTFNPNPKTYGNDLSWFLSFTNGENWEIWQGTDYVTSLLFHADGNVYSIRKRSVYRTETDDWESWILIKDYENDSYSPSLTFGCSAGDSAVYAYSRYREFSIGGIQYGGIYVAKDDGATWDMLTVYNYSATELARYENTLIIANYGNIGYAPLDVSGSTALGQFSSSITAIDVRRFGTGETIVATDGGIFKTTDGGDTWKKSDNGIMHDTVGAVQAVPLGGEDERIIYTTKQNGIFYSDDSGINWSKVDQNISVTPGLLKASPSNPQRMFAASKYVYMSNNYGATWEVIPDIPFRFYGVSYCMTYDLDIDPVNSNHIAINHKIQAADVDYGVYHIRGFNIGNEWEWSEAEDFHPYAFPIQFNDTGELIWRASIHINTAIYAFNADGINTHTITLPENEHPYLWRIEAPYCYVLSETTNHVLISSDLGDTWHVIDLNLNSYTSASWYYPRPLGEIVFSPDKGTLFLLYPGNGILASTDNGVTWGHFDDGIDTDIVYQLAFSPSDPSIMYAATESGLYRCDSPVVITDVISTVEQTTEPATYPVLQAYPNPFNPRTTISHTLPAPSEVTLSVYAVTGQKIATLVDGPMAAGSHAAVFDGKGLASGLYVARLEAGGAVQTRKMLLVK